MMAKARGNFASVGGTAAACGAGAADGAGRRADSVFRTRSDRGPQHRSVQQPVLGENLDPSTIRSPRVRECFSPSVVRRDS
jgi:hypothetical protein